MRLIATVVVLPMLMSGCVTGVVGDCPTLAAPPRAAVDALEMVHAADVDAWIVALDRHYRKLDACGAKG